MYGEKDREEQIPEAAPHKTAAVQQLVSYFTNPPSKIWWALRVN